MTSRRRDRRPDEGGAIEDRSRDLAEGELDLALALDACPVCVLSAETERAVVSWLAKVNIGETETVGRLTSTGGLCAGHWADLWRRSGQRGGRAIGLAVGAIGRSVLAELSEDTPSTAPRCPVCASMRRRDRTTERMIVERVRDGGGWRRAFAAAFGLCQPHLSETLGSITDPHDRVALIAIQRAQLERLLTALRDAADDREAAGRAARAVARKLAGGTASGRP